MTDKPIMKATRENTTIRLDPQIKLKAQTQALTERRSLSDVIEDLLIEYLAKQAKEAA